MHGTRGLHVEDALELGAAGAADLVHKSRVHAGARHPNSPAILPALADSGRPPAWKTDNNQKERTMLQELSSREGDGVSVTLYWDDQFHRTMIRLVDDRSELAELFHVPAFAAADAFDHPFVYFNAREASELSRSS